MKLTFGQQEHLAGLIEAARNLGQGIQNLLKDLEPTPSSGEETQVIPPLDQASPWRQEDGPAEAESSPPTPHDWQMHLRLHHSLERDLQVLKDRLAALEAGPKRVRYPLTEQGIKGAMASIESSADEKTPSCPMTLTEWQDWVDQMQTDVLVLKQKVAALEPGPPSPASGSLTTEEVPPGTTVWITTAAGLDVGFTWTPEGLTFMTRQTPPLPPLAPTPLGDAEQD